MIWQYTLARTGKLIADAKIHREQKLREMIQEYKTDRVSC
jgi:hypothetical protein